MEIHEQLLPAWDDAEDVAGRDGTVNWLSIQCSIDSLRTASVMSISPRHGVQSQRRSDEFWKTFSD